MARRADTDYTYSPGGKLMRPFPPILPFPENPPPDEMTIQER